MGNGYSGLTYMRLVERLESLGIDDPRKKFVRLREEPKSNSRGNGYRYNVHLQNNFGSLGTTRFGEIYEYHLSSPRDTNRCIGSFYVYSDGKPVECYDR